jgi:hypothetical protein
LVTLHQQMDRMKGNISIAIILCVALAACGNDHQQMLTRSAMNARIDSIVGSKMEDLNRQSMEDLDHRLSIEVKVKADSIVAARMAKDTAKH